MRLHETYKALSDESRLRLLHIISMGSFNVQELTSLLKLSQPTISHHIKVLQNVQLVQQQKEGTWSYYTLTPSDSPASKVAQQFLQLAKDSVSKEFLGDSEKVKNILDKRREHSKQFFDTIASQWQKVREDAIGETGGTEVNYFHKVRALIPDNDTLLDLGCGAGSLLQHMTPRAGTTIAVDYSLAMLEEAKKILGTEARDIDFRLGYLEHLPIGDQSIDTAVACMVLHHLNTPADALLDTHRVLKSGGKLIIVELNKHKNEYMRERFADLWLGFEPSQLEEWLKKAGFLKPTIEFFGKKKEVLFVITQKEKQQ